MPRSTHPPWLHRLLFRPDELSQPDGSVSMVDVMIGIQHQGPTLRDASVKWCSFRIKRVPEEKEMQGKDLMPGSGWLQRILHPQLMHAQPTLHTSSDWNTWWGQKEVTRARSPRSREDPVCSREDPVARCQGQSGRPENPQLMCSARLLTLHPGFDWTTEATKTFFYLWAMFYDFMLHVFIFASGGGEAVVQW